MRGVLGLVGRYVIECFEGAVDVVIYGDFEIAFGVVPFQVESALKVTRPVDCGLVVVLD